MNVHLISQPGVPPNLPYVMDEFADVAAVIFLLLL